MEKEAVEIKCIGVDGLIHMCEPHKILCLCGMPVSRKTVTNANYRDLYSCGDCDY